MELAVDMEFGCRQVRLFPDAGALVAMATFSRLSGIWRCRSTGRKVASFVRTGGRAEPRLRLEGHIAKAGNLLDQGERRFWSFCAEWLAGF